MLDYAFYRLPDGGEYHVVRGHAKYFSQMPAADGCHGFVMAPFCVGERCPVVVVSPEKSLTRPMPKRGGRFRLKWRAKCDRAAYRHDFQRMRQLLADGTLQEVTLARRADCKVSAWSGTLGQIFQKACRLYPHQMVALVYTGLSGAWLIISPDELPPQADGKWPVAGQPSTCGLPREKALAAILQNESIDRRYHCGVCGPWGLWGESRLYASLGCVEMRDEKNFSLYASSVLQNGSVEGREWKATKAKLDAMKKIFG